MAETLAANNINWAGESWHETFMKCFAYVKLWLNSQPNNWLYFGEGGRAACATMLSFNSIATAKNEDEFEIRNSDECFEPWILLWRCQTEPPFCIFIKMHSPDEDFGIPSLWVPPINGLKQLSL